MVTLDDHRTRTADDSRWSTTAAALAEELARTADQHDRDGTFVYEGIDALREKGFLAMLVPAELGGGGASFTETCAALELLARGCPSTALTLSMHMHLVAAQVWRLHHDQPAPILAKVAESQPFLVSTGASDWLGSSGEVQEVDGGYRVSARKVPASGCPAGSLVVTSARWSSAPDGPRVLHFAVPIAADGVSISETWDALGMRGTGSHTVVLDDVFVPDSAVVLDRPADVWHPVWGVITGVALPLIMSVYLGVAEESADRALALAGRRGDRMETQAGLGRMFGHLIVARDTVRAMVAAAEEFAFEPTLEQASVSLTRKSIASDAVIATANAAMEVAGGTGYSRSGGLERLLRDALASRYHPLPVGQQQIFTGRVILGLDPV